MSESMIAMLMAVHLWVQPTPTLMEGYYCTNSVPSEEKAVFSFNIVRGDKEVRIYGVRCFNI